MSKWREFAAILLAVCLFVTITYGLGDLLLPHRTDYGATWNQFLQEEPNSLDVLYFGSSLVYCDVIPAVVWQESGLTSYVMAGPEQTLPLTYHYVRQACLSQSPQVVVLEVSGLFFPPYPDTMKPNLLYMPWGVDRILATLRGADPQDFMEMFFPLYGTHDRVYSVSPDELAENLSPQPDTFAGYTRLTNAFPLSQPVDRPLDTGSETYQENLAYLNKIADFCAQHHIQLLLYFAPVYCSMPQPALDALRADMAAVPGARFLDCNSPDWPQFDPLTQWYDCLHLNLAGAVPFSRRLAQELTALGLSSRHSGCDDLWQSRYDALGL